MTREGLDAIRDEPKEITTTWRDLAEQAAAQRDVATRLLLAAEAEVERARGLLDEAVELLGHVLYTPIGTTEQEEAERVHRRDDARAFLAALAPETEGETNG